MPVAIPSLLMGSYHMSIQIQCPNLACGRLGKVSPRYVGLPVRCPDCQTRFRVPVSNEQGKMTDYPIAEPFAPPPATADAVAHAAVTEIIDPGEWILELPGSPEVSAGPEKIGRFQIRRRLGAGA